ncbi:NACHT domain-containing protein [Methylomagnum sp.]
MAESPDIEALQRQIAALQAQLATAQQGGAVIRDSVSAGRDFIGRDFIQVIHQVFQNGGNPEAAENLIAAYLDALARELAGLRLGEVDDSIDPARQKPLELDDVYVPLNTTLVLPEGVALSAFLASRRREARDELFKRSESRQPVPALDALAVHSVLTLLGKPGSGKSSFGAYVLLALAEAWRGREGALARLGENWAHGPLLPIRVVLRQFAETVGDGDAKARALDLWNFIAADLEQRGIAPSLEAGRGVLQRLARERGALFFLDGLDECGQGRRRERVLEAVEDLQRHAGPHCRFLLTARPYAWPDGPDADQGVYSLADFDDGQIERFITGWYDAVVRRGWLDEYKAAPKRADLLSARHRPDLLGLAGNPLLLTLMATLHTNRGRLPDDRADLYNNSVDLLILHWNKQSGADRVLREELAMPDLKLADLRGALEKLAFQVHGENIGQAGTADVGEHRLVSAFSPLLGNSWDKARRAIDYIDHRAGLLIGQGEKHGERQFTFPHRTFQEFLAACHLASMQHFATECRNFARSAPDHWREALLLAARLAKAERGTFAADGLIGHQSVDGFPAGRRIEPAGWTCAKLAGEQLLEIGLGAVELADPGGAIVQRVAGWLVKGLPVHPDDGGLPAVQRAKAGDVLARLGDPRFHGPARFCLPADENLGFVRIPADPAFCIGTRRADAARVAGIVGRNVPENELNDTPTPTPEFLIARYPVTVAQFRAYVDATGRGPGDADALRDPDTRPVRWVSWHEALAYADWLNEKLNTAPELAGTEVACLVRAGWRVALPSELEWEKAARGGLVGKVFPWGDEPDPERANTDETGIGDASAVGCFPANDYSLSDMAGNVWEWTRNLWGEDWDKPTFGYPYDFQDACREDQTAGDNVLRVVRGGAWDVHRVDSRCACRYWDRPVARYDDLGFRVVLISAPVRFLRPR